MFAQVSAYFWWSRLSESIRRPSHYEEERQCLMQPLPATLLSDGLHHATLITTD
jgi:hypothetical protein